MKPSLSVIIITKNSARTIEQCLRSVQFADEIIVLDSGSQDETLMICQKYTHLVFQTDWPGFGPQKQRALEKATGDWILSIDSDEWLSDALREELILALKNTLKDSTVRMFSFPRRNQYCGHWLRFGDVGTDKVIRVFQRGVAHFSDDPVHEKLITTESAKPLRSLLYHSTYQSIAHILEKMNWYSSLSAQMRFSRGKKTSMTRAVFASIWAFVRAYILRVGFLDGKIGFIVAISSAHSSWYRHVKLIEAGNKERMHS